MAIAVITNINTIIPIDEATEKTTMEPWSVSAEVLGDVDETVAPVEAVYMHYMCA